MIYFNNFKKEYKTHKREINASISRVLESGWYILGKEVEEFERNFAKYIGTKFCVGVANGLEALQISLLAAGIKSGDEVITVSNSAVATTLAITIIGAVPVFVDVDDYYLIDVSKIEAKITSKTKAIIPVHLFGQMADMKKIKKIADKYKLKIIEDASQAHGATQNGKKAGSIGDLGCFSFYPTKNLGAFGDGGAITTNSKKYYELCKMLRNYGQENRYIHKVKGINSRLDKIQAAILNVKLKHLDEFIKTRNKIAKIYIKNLKDIDEINLPKTLNSNYHSYHLFVIEVQRREELISYLTKRGIQTLIHYPLPIHKQNCYKEFNKIKLPKTESFAKKILSLPLYPSLEDKEIIEVCNLIRKFYQKN